MTDTDVTLHIGKQGLTESVVKELKAQLKKKGVVKVRLLRTAEGAEDRRGLFLKLGQRAGATVEKLVGYVAVYRR